MNPFFLAYARSYQAILSLGMRFLHIPYPKTLFGLGHLEEELRLRAVKHPLIVTDRGLSSLPSFALLVDALKESGIPFEIYDEVVPNPTFSCIEEGAKRYRESSCDGLIAFGGGSPMDAAKGIAILSSYPSSSLARFKGVLHVHRKLPYLLAIPTTVGTGSEATLAAVVLNEKTKDKFQIDSPRLVPTSALFDERFVMGLPPKLIASTGMDAFTHAIESYLNKFGSKKADRYALEAIANLNEHLLAFYLDPTSAEHAKGMQLAAYQAGVAFTRNFVGYVHALAHALGGYYGVPHGLANAILLVPTLKAFGKKAHRRLAKIADVLHLEGKDEKEKAEAVLAYLSSLQEQLGLPKDFGGIVENADLDLLVAHAAKEANPFYPVPRLLEKAELRAIYEEVLK